MTGADRCTPAHHERVAAGGKGWRRHEGRGPWWARCLPNLLARPDLIGTTVDRSVQGELLAPAFR